MQFMTLPQARTILLPYMERLVLAFRYSLMVHGQQPNFYLTNASPGIIFGAIDEMAYAAARQQFGDELEVVVDQHIGQNYIRFGNAVVIRVKHFDRNFRTRNARTKHNRMWVSQGAFPDMPPGARLDFGYRWDSLGIEFQDAFIALHYHEHLLWLWQVLGTEIRKPWAQLTLTPAYQTAEPTFFYDDFDAV